MITVKVLPEFGRSVIAEKWIQEGAYVEVADVLVLSETDTKVVNSTALVDYTFTFNDTQDCLVMGVGEMFNHSNLRPNVEYKLYNLNGMWKMYFIATRCIEAGEQLFIDYSADLRANEDKAAYTHNLM
jgi:SET domain-containing protein